MRSSFVIRFVATLVLSIAVAIGSAPVRGTGLSIDQSDLWWNPAESGWGVQFVQTGSAIFATMYVYGPSGQPIWYSATLEAQSAPSTWSGDLIATTGSWFGTAPFNPTLVARRTVGKMTWNAQAVESGTLTYAVDGVTVSKTLYRMPQRYDDQAGTFYGIAKLRLCTPRAGPLPSATGGLTPIAIYDCLQFSFQTTFTINPTASELVAGSRIPIASPPPDCTFTGDYAQFGRFGKSQGTFACTDGTHGTHTFDQMTVQRVGEFEVGSAQLSGSDSSGHTFDVTMTGIR